MKANGRAIPRNNDESTFATDSRDLPLYPVSLLLVPFMVLTAVLADQVYRYRDFINYDCAFYLLCSKLLLSGLQPFEHFVDLLPPLIFYFSVPPWWFSNLTHVPIESTWSILVAAAVVASGLSAIFVLRNAVNVAVRDWLLIGPLLCGFMLFNLIVFFHFGQREHLFVLTLFPIFLLRWLRWTSSLSEKFETSIPILSTVLGIACGAAVFVKPQLLLLLIAIEMSLSANSPHRTQWRSILPTSEVKALASTLIVCAICSLFIPNIGEYWNRWVPFLLNGYPAFNSPSLLEFSLPDGHMIGNRYIAFGICALSAILLKRCSLCAPLLAWTLSGLLVYMIQGRGWAYQSIPFVSGYVLLISVVVGIVVTSFLDFLGRTSKVSYLNKFALFYSGFDRVGSRAGAEPGTETEPQAQTQPVLTSSDMTKFATISFILFAAAMIPLNSILFKNSMVTGRAFNLLDGLLERETKPGDKVVVLHTALPHAHQFLLKRKLIPACRYIWCFPLRMTGFLRDGESGTPMAEFANTEENKVVDEIRRDIEKTQPKFVIIEAWHSGPTGWNLYQSLETHQFTKNALKQYVPYGECDNCAVWKLEEPKR